jgi:putative ABC transport system substrate-binding protein
MHAIAENFHIKKDIAGIFAIATPAAQAVSSIEKQKPLCVAAVSVLPELKSLFCEENIFGVSDAINVPAQIEAMHELLPECKTIGILYSSGEINSLATSRSMAQELEKHGLRVLFIEITSEIDIEMVLTSAVRKIDALLTPTDNMVASSIALIVDITHTSKKPLIVSDILLVKYGALMGYGVDYYESGRQAGILALDVFLQKKNPVDISIVSADSQKIVVNKGVCQELGIVIPHSIKDSIDFV